MFSMSWRLVVALVRPRGFGHGRCAATEPIVVAVVVVVVAAAARPVLRYSHLHLAAGVYLY